MLRGMIGVLALAVATSCTPVRHKPAHLTLDVPPPTARTLLRQLALDVPDEDLPDPSSGMPPIEMAAAPRSTASRAPPPTRRAPPNA
ncbi:hypothetical protein P0F65_02895 [Sphingomonas sp. I4]